jgi:hypothetical protein
MRNALFPRLLPAAACLLVAACGPAVESGMYASGTPQPRPAEGPVRIYQAARPECPYEEIGMVRGTPRTRFDSLDDIFDAMRQRARAMGGDAIVNLSIQQSTGRTVVVTSESVPVASATHSTTYSGTVVRFPGGSCAAASETRAS